MPTEIPPSSEPQHKGSLARSLFGWTLIAAGVAGCLLPIIPGIPLLLAGAAVLGDHHPAVKHVKGWIAKRASKPVN
jgi:uncharacterized membrane protein YbaN (DUF454 family)